MLRVIIADNDDDNRKNFKTFIRSSFNSSFQVARAIDDKSDIISVISDTNAKLVIADIKFFGVGSYQKIKKIHQYFGDVRLLLYGTYSDTEYMEKAMEAGVIAYIYKPVKPSELTRALNQAKLILDELEAKNADYKLLIEDYQKRLPVFVDRFLINLVHGHLSDEMEIRDTFDYFGMRIERGYTVFVVKIDHYRQISLALDQRERHLLIFSILNKIKFTLDKINNGVAFINHFDSITVILGGDLLFNDIMALCEQIKDVIKSEANTIVSVGVGKTYLNAVNIPVSYKQAKSALRYNFCMGYNVVIPIQYVEPDNDITYRYPLKKEELLVYTAVIGDLESSLEYTDEIFMALRNCGDLPHTLIPKIILDIWVSINRYVTEQKSLNESSLSNFFTVKEISAIASLDEGHRYLRNTLERFCGFINDLRKEKDFKLIEAAKLHVSTNYFLNISLSKMAVKLGTTPEYLNKLFLDNENKSFFDYAVGVRMSVAKKLLENPDLQEDTIAVSLGYDDAKYFRSVFQRYEGMSTSEYRIKVRGFVSDSMV